MHTFRCYFEKRKITKKKAQPKASTPRSQIHTAESTRNLERVARSGGLPGVLRNEGKQEMSCWNQDLGPSGDSNYLLKSLRMMLSIVAALSFLVVSSLQMTANASVSDGVRAKPASAFVY